MLTHVIKPTVSTFLVKIASRCNLACDYCYMYQHADQSWRDQPAFMSKDTVSAFVSRVREYVEAVHAPSVSITVHGGEPLLADPGLIEHLCQGLRLGLPASCEVDLSLQSNATLLTEEWLNLFSRWNVTLSLSLDGNQAANDRHRVAHTGNSSYEAVAGAMQLMRSHPQGMHLLSGMLAVIDLANDPVATFEHLVSLGAPNVDFLLPDGTYEALPAGLNQPGVRSSDAWYGRWLAQLFDHWYSSDTHVGIRLFENIMDLCLGGSSRTEGVGLGCFSILTVETNGEIQDVDVLKIAFPGAPRIGPGFTIYQNSFADVLQSAEVLERSRLAGRDGLCATCRKCPVVRECGGGHLPHRFRLDNGFDNPSIYCGDLAYLIKHIGQKLSRDLAVAKE